MYKYLRASKYPKSRKGGAYRIDKKLYYEDCELLKRVAVFIMAITIYYVSWYYGKDILMNLFYGYIKNGVLKPKLFFSHLLIYGSIFSAICSYIMIFSLNNLFRNERSRSD